MLTGGGLGDGNKSEEESASLSSALHATRVLQDSIVRLEDDTLSKTDWCLSSKSMPRLPRISVAMHKRRSSLLPIRTRHLTATGRQLKPQRASLATHSHRANSHHELQRLKRHQVSNFKHTLLSHRHRQQQGKWRSLTLRLFLYYRIAAAGSVVQKAYAGGLLYRYRHPSPPSSPSCRRILSCHSSISQERPSRCSPPPSSSPSRPSPPSPARKTTPPRVHSPSPSVKSRWHYGSHGAQHN